MISEYLVEQHQARDNNTVSFATYDNSNFAFNDFGFPQELALILDDLIPKSKPIITTPNTQLCLPMNNFPYDFQSTKMNEQNRMFEYPEFPSNSNKVETDLVKNQMNYAHVSRIPPQCQHEYLCHSFTLECLPDLESVFSDFTVKTPTITSNQDIPSNQNIPSSQNIPNYHHSLEELLDVTSNHMQPKEVQQLEKLMTNTNLIVPKKRRRKHVMARSRTGCWICRIKHLKCDELRPSCNNCSRFGIQCDFAEIRPEYVLDMNLRREKLNSIAKKRRRSSN